MGHGVGQQAAMAFQIQPQDGRGDDFDGQRLEASLRGGANALEPLAHHGQGVFSREEQDLSLAMHVEPTQTRRSRSHAHRDVQGQEAFTAFGFAAEDADGAFGPQLVDEPLGLRSARGEIAGALHGKQVHGSL